MIVLHHLTASFEHGTEERFKVVAVRLGAEKTPTAFIAPAKRRHVKTNFANGDP